MIDLIIFLRFDREGEVDFVQGHEAGVDFAPRFEKTTKGVHRFSVVQMEDTNTIVDQVVLFIRSTSGLPEVTVERGKASFSPVEVTRINDLYRVRFWLSKLSPEEFGRIAIAQREDK